MENRAALNALTSKPAPPPVKRTTNYQGQNYNSTDSVRDFFARQGKKVDTSAFEPRERKSESRAESSSGSGTAKRGGGLTVGTRVRHAKFGVGLIVKREGEDDNVKLTINFPGYGQKKMIEKFAGLEKA